MSYTPPLFDERSETGKAVVGGVVPALIGGLVGFLAGVSAGAYWTVAVLAGVGAVLGGFEHRNGWDAADRGLLGGAVYGTALLLVHEIIRARLKVSLGNPPGALPVVTAIFGMLASATGGHLARGRRKRATASP